MKDDLLDFSSGGGTISTIEFANKSSHIITDEDDRLINFMLSRLAEEDEPDLSMYAIRDNKSTDNMENAIRIIETLLRSEL